MKRLQGIAVALLSLLLLAATPLPSEPTHDFIATPQTPSATPSPKVDSPRGEGEHRTDGRVVPQQPPEANQLSSEAAQDDQQRKSLELNRRLTDYTGNLADYTRLLVIVGILQTVVAGFQIVLLCKSFGVSRQATSAAQQSAKTYATMLAASRPIVVVANFHLANFMPEPTKKPSSQPPIKAYFDIENAGMSPAMIKSAQAKLILVAEGTFPEIHYPHCRVVPLSKIVLGPKERLAGQRGDLDYSTAITFEDWYIDPFDYSDVLDVRKQLLVYGLIQYRSLTDDRLYDTPFLWIVQANSVLLESGESGTAVAFCPGPEGYNRSS